MCPLYREIVSPLSEVPLYHAVLQYYPYYMYQYLRMAIVVWGKVRGWVRLCTCLMGNRP